MLRHPAAQFSRKKGKEVLESGGVALSVPVRYLEGVTGQPSHFPPFTVPGKQRIREPVFQLTLFACIRFTIKAIYKASQRPNPALEGPSSSPSNKPARLSSGSRTAPPSRLGTFVKELVRHENRRANK